MAFEPFPGPRIAGGRIDVARLTRAVETISGWTTGGAVPAVSVCLAQAKGEPVEFAAGRASDGPDAARVETDTTFLVASLTKPLTAFAVTLLAERGRILLDEPVSAHLPEFVGEGRESIRIRHLLTHTSGLPDMLPENVELRSRHAPPEEFFRAACRTPLLFAPGSEVRYQSQGLMVASELVRRVDGRPLPAFLRDEVFGPVGMTRTSLGVDKASLVDHAWLRIPPDAAATDWHWNSPYWLGFGAPWGGLVTTASDYAKFLRMMLRGGELGVRLTSAAAAAEIVANQLPNIPGLGADWIRDYPWGLGWRLRWPGRSQFFGDFVGPRMFGHWGSTGTVAWVDPDRDAVVVVLTTLPQDPDGPYLTRASNLLSACFLP